MKHVVRSILTAVFFLFISCASVTPTPLLMGRMDKLNTEVVNLYLDCSDGANYLASKEGCNPELLKEKVSDLLDLSEEFISADIYQPHGYDVHLSTSMIYFRIAVNTSNNYTRAEQIARQFFEIQKATGGHSLTTARFYLAWFTAARASYQYYNEISSLNVERKKELLEAFNEGTAALSDLEGAKAIRLTQALEILTMLIAMIK